MPFIDSLPLDTRPEIWPTLAEPEIMPATGGPCLKDWLRSPALQQMDAYWNDRRGDAAMPDRADIDPLDLSFMLGWLMLVDRTAEDGEFRFRLVGSRVAQIFGCDLTGHSIKALPQPNYADFIRDRFWDTVDRACPIASRYGMTFGSRQVLMERLDQPLTKGGDRVEIIMTALVPLARARASDALRAAL